MANLITDLTTGLTSAVLNVWYDFLRIVPGLLGALVLIIVGIAVGLVLKRIVMRILDETKIDHWLAAHNLKAAIGHHSLARLVGSLVKWYVIAIFLAQAVDLIQMRVLKQYTGFLISFINSAIAALIVLLLGLLLARYIRNLIEQTEYHYKRTLAILAEVFIIYVGVVIALQTVGFNTTILIDAFRIGFTVLVWTVAIVAGLLFALAFRKDIAQFVDDMRKEMKDVGKK